MKILLINEKYSCGGAEEIVNTEFNLLLSSNCDVKLLTFDPDQCSNDYNQWINYSYNPTRIFKPLSRLLPFGFLYKKTFNLLESFKPDVIHIHNIVVGSAQVYRAISNYCHIESDSSHYVFTLQTLHDFGCICPLSWCTRPDGSCCSGYRLNNCFYSCSFGFTDSIRYCLLLATNYFRFKSISKFTSPSNILSKLASLNSFNTVTLYNPCYVNYAEIKPHFSCNDFLYFGRIGKRKGVFQLIDSWREFTKINTKAKLSFVGFIDSDCSGEFESVIADIPSIKYEGPLSHSEMIARVKSAFCVVCPSIWMENSPNTIRESIFVGTIAIGSDRGGIPEMLSNPNLLFDPFDPNTIVKALCYVSSLTCSDYIDIVSSLRDNLLLKSSPRKYLDSLFKLINSSH